MNSTRPLYWSMQRELWENRSIYIAPLVVTIVVLFGSLFGTIGLSKKVRNLQADPAKQHEVVTPFNMAPAPIMLTTFIVGFFYSLDALYGERRDRSLLFWKSLPVSDMTAVLSKVSIPLVVLPLLGLLLSVATVVNLMLFGTVVLLANGVSPARLWAGFNLFQEPLIMLYGLTVFALWWAPIHGWLLLISAWARRTPIIWALLPPFAIAMVERFVLDTKYCSSLLRYRFMGPMTEAFKRTDGNITRFSELDPARFLNSPGLWGGLVFATLCFAAAARLRRKREPI